MKSNRLIPAAIAATALGLSAGFTTAYAGNDGSYGKKMEQQANQMQGAIKDAWLDGKLETALLFNEHLNSFDIDTDVKHGTAWLTGAVESDIDRDLAGEIARSIDGIVKVENKLVVDATKAASANSSDTYRQKQGFKQGVMNATLTARIKSKLMLNGNTSGLAIDVDSKDGNVTLSGTVDSEQEKDLAERIAANVAGAQTVTNRLTVDTEVEAE